VKYTGINDCFLRVYKEQGALSFWRGNWVNCVRYFPTQALNFAFKDFFKYYLNPYNPKTEPVKSFLGNCLSGGAAGAAGLCFVYPLDFARTRLSADVAGSAADREFNGLFDCMKKIAARDGPIGLYRGFVLGAVGIVFYRGAYFGLYDTGKSYDRLKNANLFVTWMWAQFVSMFSTWYIYPMDTVRRRLMMQSGLPKDQMRYTGTLDCAKKIMAEEGFRAFYKGALTNAIRGTGCALVLVFYEKFEKQFVE